jgi:two-component system sensor histidine kinase DesK
MGAAADIVLDARRVQRARSLTLIWLATTVFTSVLMPGVGVLREERPLWSVLGSVGIVLFAFAQGGVLYGAVTPRVSEPQWRIAFVIASALTVLLVGPVAAGSWQTWAWVGAGIVGVLPLLLGWARALACSALVCVTGVGVALASGGSPVQSLLIISVIGASIALLNVGPVWLWTVIADAKSAREAVAALAVSEERLRFAREVHDVLGHSLTVIALKAELIERSIEPPRRAVHEQAEDIRRLAASALDEVRAAVADTRRVGFAEELQALCRILEASGIRSETRLSAGVPDSHAAVLAGVLREAVTNVLRHSRADWCLISIEQRGNELVLVVRNDGVMDAADGNPGGNGLVGMRERLREHGGRLAVFREGDQFELRATVEVP